MESREKCEQIIQIFNGTLLAGAKDPLLVKFADGGSKKKSAFKGQTDPNARTWREVTEVSRPCPNPVQLTNRQNTHTHTPRHICTTIDDHDLLFDFLDNAGYSSCI